MIDLEAIHQSTANMFLRCGEQGRRRYIEGEKIPPSIAAGRGTGVHAGNAVNLRQKVLSHEDLSLPDLQDAARDGYVKAFADGIYLTKEDLPAKDKLINEGLNDTIRLTGLYRKEVAPGIQPVTVEDPFYIDVGLPLALAGTMDYQEKPKVGDLKTSTRSWPKTRIYEEIQPDFYSFVHEHTTGIRPTFVYDVLVALKNEEKHQPLSKVSTEADYNALFSKIQAILKMLETGTFPPANPTSWWCGEKWCGYWYSCPYVGNSLPVKWV